ncbi:aminotransferase class IV [Streptomyces sp. DSM 44915]|uniref:Aminotransferase class IV n=1 Tax=Streptomyces chisholmiae TaxID=3075540 RepID=A0ABU2JVH5_9ACTN|nr:aminotransferase class IV [Streptomyces sp. DSM 44915]MDT0268940.1 aminotransferase class IV [Streptomyces sp. DSM 44915]
MALIWLDGELRDADSARVSVFDHGLTVGDGVFETLKTEHGRPFALRRHLDRLAVSAAGLGLPEPDRDEVSRAAHAVLEAVPLDRGRLRITYTGGRAPLGSDRGDAQPTLVVAHAEAKAPPESTAVITVPWTRNERGALTGLKTTSYAENVLALARARQQAATEALFGNNAGQLCEGTGTNVFVVLEGVTHTPPLSAGCLAGVTRALVVEWLDVQETELPMDCLRFADEIFLTSSTRDVQAVRRVDDRELPGAPGPVATEALRVFRARSAEDIDP